MIRSALLLCAALLAGVCFACAQQTVGPSPAAFPKTVCPAIANVMMTSPSPPTSAMGAPPTIGTVPPNILTDLQAAFNAAPTSFQTQLCSLDGIFVTQGPDSWGYRDIISKRRYIAVSTSLWGACGPISLNQYENRVFGGRLGWATRQPEGPPPLCASLPLLSADGSPPTYLSPTPNDRRLPILSALAHEFGHVLWADIVVVPNHPGLPDSRFCNRVLNDAWSGNLQGAIWKNFEDLDPNPASIPDDDGDAPVAGDPQPAFAKVNRLQDAVRNGQFARAHRILRRILAKPRPFPSLLGAFSANEQFVETFTLATLLRAGLTSLPLQVSPGNPNDIVDIANDIVTVPSSRKRLRKVLGCFQYPP